MDTIQLISSDKILDPVDPMRSDMDRDKIDDLAASIKQVGLIQPLTVRPVIWCSICDKPWATGCLHVEKDLSSVHYEVVAGHRRFTACKIAGVVQIPCVVKELSEEETINIRAHENLFREDLDPVEEAVAIAKLIGEDESKIPDIAKRMSKSVAWVEARLNILTFPDYLIAYIKQNKISLGVAGWLARIEDDVYRKMFVDQAVANGLAVFQAEYYFRQWEAGVFKQSSDIMPPIERAGDIAPVSVRATCARCGGIATSPNLKSVFIHIDCPSDPPPSGV